MLYCAPKWAGAVDVMVVSVVVSDRTEGAGEENVEGDLREVAVVVMVWFDGFGWDEGPADSDALEVGDG